MRPAITVPDASYPALTNVTRAQPPVSGEHRAADEPHTATPRRSAKPLPRARRRRAAQPARPGPGWQSPAPQQPTPPDHSRCFTDTASRLADNIVAGPCGPTNQPPPPDVPSPSRRDRPNLALCDPTRLCAAPRFRRTPEPLMNHTPPRLAPLPSHFPAAAPGAAQPGRPGPAWRSRRRRRHRQISLVAFTDTASRLRGEHRGGMRPGKPPPPPDAPSPSDASARQPPPPDASSPAPTRPAALTYVTPTRLCPPLVSGEHRARQ